MEHDLPDVDTDALWDAVGSKDWPRVGEILKDSGYDFEDLGMLAIMSRDGDDAE